MTVKVVDGERVHGEFDRLLKNFMPFAKKRLGYDKPVDVQLVSDPENAKDPLGKTAYYDPNLMRITVFVDKRHAKDILRSLAHELVHHKQNCEGKLDNLSGEGGPGYAQNNEHLREMEAEAYLHGSGLLLRDWEDNLKKEGEKDMNEKGLQEVVQKIVNIIKEDMSLMEGDAPSGTLEKLREVLNQADEIPPEIVEIILEKVQLVLGSRIDESEKKPTNENWARAGKDKQLFEELLSRWCK